MPFDPAAYGPAVAELLALDAAGQRLMPLVARGCSSKEAARRLADFQFPAHARSPRGALAGLWLYFSAFDEAHKLAQDLATPEGSYWHAIAHRQEPDDGNACYWFDRVGEHAIFPSLAAEAAAIAGRYRDAGWKPPVPWDPARFVECTAAARRAPGSPLEWLALEIQRAEWQLLFDFCARPGSSS